MRRLFKFFKLGFDRSFSGAWYWQVAWLSSVIAATMALLIWLDHRFAHLDEMRIVELMLDPGAFVAQPDDPSGYGRIPLLLVALVGAVLFTGMLITVVSNILTRRIERFRNGEIRYRFSDHIVILGMNEMVPHMIEQLCEVPANRGRDIVILTVSEIEPLRLRLQTELDRKYRKRTVLMRGRRDSREEIERIAIGRAAEVYLIGEEREPEHDSVNIDSLRIIAETCLRKKRKTPLACRILFEYRTSFHVFQSSDFGNTKQFGGSVELSVMNFHESWAERVFISGHAGSDGRRIDYAPLDREPVTAQSEKGVHLIVFGMTRMGIAMAMTAAHTAHYPNFHTKGIRTRITFIDPDAEREMHYFQGNYANLFEHSRSTFMRIGRDGTLTGQSHLPKSDFLDVAWDFVEGRIESPEVRQLIEAWCVPPVTLPTIAICGDTAPANIAAALYLPDAVYQQQVPVLVYQQQSATILSVAGKTGRYAQVKPFGMATDAYDGGSEERLRRAKRVCWLYDYFNTHGELPLLFPSEKELSRRWNALSLPLRWSNLYMADTIPSKFRSVGYDPTLRQSLSENEVETLARTEHNRWNVEKLMIGYRPVDATEELEIEADITLKERYKKDRFAHYDIRPFDDLRTDAAGNNAAEYDRCITRGLPLVIKK